MNEIPLERYAGSVTASGVYGLPSLGSILTRRNLFLFALVAIALALFLNGSHDHMFLAGAGLTSTELAKELAKEREQFKTWYDENKNPAGTFAGPIDEFRKRNDALGELNQKWVDADAVENAVKANEASLADLKAPLDRQVRGHDDYVMGDQMRPQKTLGELFIESKAYTDRPHTKSQGPEVTIDLDKQFGKGRGFKTLFDTSTGFAIQNVRLPEPITPGAQQPTIASLMPEGRTSGNAIVYMEETTTTSNAVEVGEGLTKPEAALAFTERTSNVRKIAVSLPVTDESLDDVPFMETYIDGRLSFFIRQREDSELLVGDATGVNLRGIQATSGIQTQAAGTDNNQDAILKAITQININAFFDADAVILHPNNWQTMRLAKDDIGNYLFGPPNIAGPLQVWGYPIIKTTAQTANTGLAGAFRASAQVFRRTDLTMQVGWVNDQFIKNQRTILVEERLALVVFRPKGFTKITGLA